MNDEINPDKIAEEWEMSLQELPTGKNRAAQAGDEVVMKGGVSRENLTEDWAVTPQKIIQPKEEPAEDWAITEPLKQPSTAPNKSGWELPKPQFRTSEGYTPKTAAPVPVQAAPENRNPIDFSTLQAPEIPADSSAAPAQPKQEAPPAAAPAFESAPSFASAAPSAAAVPPAFTGEVEPQPDVIEEIVVAPAAAPAAAVKPKSKVWRIVGIVAGLLAMLTFIIGFLILIYYFFIHKTVVE